MEKKEVIRLAEKVGMVVYEGGQDRVVYPGAILESFGKLIDAANAEALEKKEPNIFVSLDANPDPSISVYVPAAFQSDVIDAIKLAFKMGQDAGALAAKKMAAAA